MSDPGPEVPLENSPVPLASQVEARLRLTEARLAGLEQLLQRGEGIGIAARDEILRLLRDLGVEENHSEWPLWRLPTLASNVRDRVVDARNQLGMLPGILQELEDRAQRSEAEAAGLRRQLSLLRSGRGFSSTSAPAGAGTSPKGARVVLILSTGVRAGPGGLSETALCLAQHLSARHRVHVILKGGAQGLSGVAADADFSWTDLDQVSRSGASVCGDPRTKSLISSLEADIVHVFGWEDALMRLQDCKFASSPLFFLTLDDYSPLCHRNGRMLKSDGERCQVPVPEVCASCKIESVADSEGASPWVNLLPAGLRRLFRNGPGESNTDFHPSDRPLPSPTEVRARLSGVRRSMDRLERVFVPSQWMRQLLVESEVAASERVDVLDSGVDPETFRALSRTSRPGFLVGFCGELRPDSGVAVLIEALNCLTDLGDFNAEILGRFDQNPSFVDDLRSAARNPRIRLEDVRETKTAAQRICSWNLLVVPSLWWDAAPASISWAYAAGVPVLSSSIGSVGEKVVPGHGGLHVAPGDPASLAARLRQLYADPSHLDHLAARRPLVWSQSDALLRCESFYSVALARARP